MHYALHMVFVNNNIKMVKKTLTFTRRKITMSIRIIVIVNYNKHAVILF